MPCLLLESVSIGVFFFQTWNRNSRRALHEAALVASRPSVLGRTCVDRSIDGSAARCLVSVPVGGEAVSGLDACV